MKKREKEFVSLPLSLGRREKGEWDGGVAFISPFSPSSPSLEPGGKGKSDEKLKARRKSAGATSLVRQTLH